MNKTTEVNQQNLNIETSNQETSFEVSSVAPNLINNLIADWKSVYKYDPAARNWLEVLFCYPGLQALVFHRFAHWLNGFRLPFIPRFLSFVSRLITGIEIHPGAKIGKGVFIDHGMGVVIGETAIMSETTALFIKGVTLGGTG
jgi:serine O-acetyltransferase